MAFSKASWLTWSLNSSRYCSKWESSSLSPTPSKPTSWYCLDWVSLSNAFTSDCKVETRPQMVVSTLLTRAVVGRPFSNDFRESFRTSSEISPRLKYSSPPSISFRVSFTKGSIIQNSINWMFAVSKSLVSISRIIPAQRVSGDFNDPSSFTPAENDDGFVS